jgi:hypothetical protein
MIATVLAVAMLAAGDEAGGLLPPDGFLGAWSRVEKARHFRGAELYGHIDGGAELFLEFGFGALTLQRYRHGEDEIALEIYRMADPIAATGIYLMKCGREIPADGFAPRHTVGRYQLAITKDRYYVLVTSEHGAGAGSKDLLEFGRHVAGRIQDDPAVELLGRLPRPGLIEGSLRLIRGPYGMQPIATLGPGNILRLGPDATAVTADYGQAGGSRRTMIAIDYPNAEVATTVFRALVRDLDPELRKLETSEARLVFAENSGAFGEARLEGRALTIEMGLASRPPAP